MIIVKLNGGIGAQMLQYSLGRQLSILNKTELYLDDSWFKEHNCDLNFPRDFKLDCLHAKFNLLNSQSIYWKFRLTDRLKQWNPLAYQKIVEQDFSKYDPSILKAGNNIVLDGYWNSYKYFENIKSILEKELIPREAPNAHNDNCLKKINQVNAVSVHFRRGDYGKTSFHGMLTKSYYNDAIRVIKEKVSNPYLFLFSDEPDWVLNNFHFDLPYEVVAFNGNNKNYWDIHLMRNCKHHVIANSSFSWWGAWLNNYAGKIVIAPKTWIAEKKRTMNDFIPSEWLRI